ncbi:hypothetical protein WJ33_16420 [Burkholderia ubonensis]|uniref:Uncharacterized protein n=1 Tax=Burkholderia ubonensis TaxID=101571 RepID=A0A103RTL0_9BURK|nr:hypothetical protein WJ33_16420 [Burkholderia ubonensis]
MLVNCSPEHIQLAAQRHEDFVEMPRDAGLATRGVDAMCEGGAEPVAPAVDRLMADDHTVLEQQFLDVAQAELEPEYQRTAWLMTDAGKGRPW